MSDVYHEHLDVCAQCRNHPFGLCPEGARKLHEAVGVPFHEKPPQEDSEMAVLFGGALAVHHRGRPQR